MFNFTELIDISIPLGESTPVFPGDPTLSLSLDTQIAQGAAYNFSTVTMGVHTGTHVDAPWHFLDDGCKINQVPLNALVGGAEVYELTGLDRITASTLASLDIRRGARVLFKTDNSERWGQTSEVASNYVALTADAAHVLVRRGVQTVGIDYLSVDAPDQSDFPVHRALLENQIAIIEGLNLRHVCAGEYLLVCLPLKFADAEAAPARTILLR
ncbi:cyclase family protein [Candidatus Poribacteria bacterium]|nr:cyclase family protein [Candidatus Poribacteria bacterium]